ncbi:hypothetical protein QJS10_CPB20g00139 [Acorus calamus]|uniref:Uncharacterized protein n=1 Tax=Acorus calamus TaxID=4465 RepID=A0AAV9CCJ2_ACOCL|nr:hypothetical protein QJS10_CPB20g00139 [Acorus calamus]
MQEVPQIEVTLVWRGEVTYKRSSDDQVSNGFALVLLITIHSDIFPIFHLHSATMLGGCCGIGGEGYGVYNGNTVRSRVYEDGGILHIRWRRRWDLV